MSAQGTPEMPLFWAQFIGVGEDGYGEFDLIEGVAMDGLNAEQASFALYGRKKKDESVYQVTLSKQSFGWRVEWWVEADSRRMRVELWDRAAYVEGAKA